INDLREAISYVSRDDEVRAAVLTGAGRAFCAGGDFRYSMLREGKVTPKEAEDTKDGDIMYLNTRQGRLPSSLHKEVILGLIEMQKPTIAMINGDAVGGGFEFTLACDIRVASEQARVGVGFTRIGLTPGLGMTWLLPRIVGLGRALEFIYLADYWSAEDAYRIGIMNKVLPLDKLESETTAIARRLAEGPPISLRLSKMQVYSGFRMDLDVALTLGGASEYTTLLSDDHMEGIEAFAHKRKPIYKDR
ncbi:enoyl-CoA hydratase/isomerase family protein, partial [Chloroflexota bacterium]